MRIITNVATITFVSLEMKRDQNQLLNLILTVSMIITVQSIRFANTVIAKRVVPKTKIAHALCYVLARPVQFHNTPYPISITAFTILIAVLMKFVFMEYVRRKIFLSIPLGNVNLTITVQSIINARKGNAKKRRAVSKIKTVQGIWSAKTKCVQPQI